MTEHKHEWSFPYEIVSDSQKSFCRVCKEPRPMTTPLTDKESLERLEAIKSFIANANQHRRAITISLDDLRFVFAALESSRERARLDLKRIDELIEHGKYGDARQVISLIREGSYVRTPARKGAGE